MKFRVVWAFLGSLALVVLLGIAADFWLLGTAPDATNTISWQMALWGYGNPGLVYFLGVACGAAFIGLPVHFWLGQPTPQLWSDYQDNLHRVAYLEHELELRDKRDGTPRIFEPEER